MVRLMIIRLKKINLSEINKVSLIFAVVFFVFSWAPMKSDTTMNVSGVRMVLRAIYLLCIVLLLLFFGARVQKKFEVYSILLAICPVLYFCFNYFHAYIPANANWTVIVLLILFAMFDKNIKACTIEYIKIGMIIVSVIGIICWASSTLGLPLPYVRTYYYSADAEALGIYYRNYFNLSYLIDYANFGFFRLCGIFNESGEFGVFLALLLCTERINLKRKRNIILLIGGCLTLSLAFFAIIILYIIYQSRHNLKIVIVLGLVLFSVLWIPSHVTTGITLIDILLSRISRSTSGSVGAGRISASVLDFLENHFFKSGSWLFGYGTGYVAQEIHTGNSSLLVTVIEQGVFGTLILYGILLIVTLSYNKRYLEAIIYILLNYISFYQRPYLYNIAYFIIFIGGIELIKSQIDSETRDAINKHFV